MVVVVSLPVLADNLHYLIVTFLRSPHTVVVKTFILKLLRLIDIPQIKEIRFLKKPLQFVEFEVSELVPFSNNDKGICIFHCIVGIFAVCYVREHTLCAF